MKKIYMLKYFISFLALTFCLSNFSQEKTKDSLYKSTYGLKLGIDLSKQIRMLTEPDYKGLVLIGDYRFSEKIYIAFEIGSEKKLVENEILNFNTKGSFFKTGINYNIFKKSFFYKKYSKFMKKNLNNLKAIPQKTWIYINDKGKKISSSNIKNRLYKNI